MLRLADRTEYLKEWYQKNRESLSEKRKQAYSSDPEYRERRLKQSNRYYWLSRRRAVSLKKVDIDVDKLQPDEIADVIISNENDVRCGTVVPVPMYYPGTMAKILRRSVQTLRLWALRGYVPEATYRNPYNYRLFTKDQLKVYIDHSHLLKLNVKDFAKHPYFVEVMNGLQLLEPDGIVPMSITEWRLSDGKCKWCGTDGSMQYFKEGNWVDVPCLSCKDPYKMEDRKTVVEQEVYGTCSFCDTTTSKSMHVINNIVVLICSNCGRRISEVHVKESG